MPTPCRLAYPLGTARFLLIGTGVPATATTTFPNAINAIGPLLLRRPWTGRLRLLRGLLRLDHHLDVGVRLVPLIRPQAAHDERPEDEQHPHVEQDARPP